MSNTNNVGVEVCVPTPMVFGFFFRRTCPQSLKHPWFSNDMFRLRPSAVVEISSLRLCEAGTGRVPGLRKEMEGRRFVHWILLMAEDGGCCCIGKKLVWIHSLQHLQPLGMDRWKLVVFLYKAFFSGCITLCLYSSVCSAFIKRLSQLVLRIALSLVSLCSLISILAIGQCMATANTLPCISCPFVWFSVFL